MSIEGEVRKIFQELIDNCQASTAETGISAQRKEYRKDLLVRAKNAILKLTNLKPLSEEDIMKILVDNGVYGKYIGQPEKIAKVICSHFSKPEIKWIEKKVCLIEQEANQITNDQLKDYETYKYGYNTCINDMRLLNGEGGV